MSEFLACCVVLAASFANLGRTERAHTWHTENAIRTTSLSVGFVRLATVGVAQVLKVPDLKRRMTAMSPKRNYSNAHCPLSHYVKST